MLVADGNGGMNNVTPSNLNISLPADTPKGSILNVAGGLGSGIGAVIQDLSKDVVLDEEAFEKAAQELADLSEELQSLRSDVEGRLAALSSGFSSPAGKKFITSCQENLLTPLDQQKIVLEHISSTLKEVRSKYTTVFTEYEKLNTTIRSYEA